MKITFKKLAAFGLITAAACAVGCAAGFAVGYFLVGASAATAGAGVLGAAVEAIAGAIIVAATGVAVAVSAGLFGLSYYFFRDKKNNPAAITAPNSNTTVAAPVAYTKATKAFTVAAEKVATVEAVASTPAPKAPKP